MNLGGVRDAIVGDEGNGEVVVEAETHVVGVFRGVFEVLSEHGDGAEAAGGEEQLCGDIGFADLKDDLAAPLLRKFVNQPLNHLASDAVASDCRADGEVEYPQHGLMKFINHEADDAVVKFCHRANTVSLAQAAQEFFFRPGLLEAAAFDAQYLVHVTANKPANLSA